MLFRSLDWQSVGQPFLKKLQAEAMKNSDELADADMIPVAARRMWTSALQFCMPYAEHAASLAVGSAVTWTSKASGIPGEQSGTIVEIEHHPVPIGSRPGMTLLEIPANLPGPSAADQPP